MARVLICEPHEDISALLALVVRRLGHDALAWGGDDLDLREIDAAVIEPGDADCLSVARRLRANGVPVLFTSIFPSDDGLLALGPCVYLVKPFPLSALERALGEALGPTLDASVSTAAVTAG